jgi:hypothetical protein
MTYEALELPPTPGSSSSPVRPSRTPLTACDQPPCQLDFHAHPGARGASRGRDLSFARSSREIDNQRAEATLQIQPGPKTRPGRDRGAFAEGWRSEWAHVRWLPDGPTTTASVCRHFLAQWTVVGAIEPIISAGAFGSPPAEASRDAR